MIQPLRPASITSVRALPRMRLLMTLSLADLSSEHSFPHNLGPKYRSECLLDVTELNLWVVII